MRIISPRTTIDNKQYYLSFAWKDSSSCGFAFSCDKDGNLLQDKNETALSNYNKCISGEFDVVFEGIKTYEWTYVQPAIGECFCGEEVVLQDFTNTCESCGRDYNSAGQELAPREQWGETEGDYLCDILRIK